MTPLHIDAACLVVVKPAGLLSVPGRGEHLQDCLSARVQAAWPDARVVHRLDMATSGLMLFARGDAAQRNLSQAFAQREIHKHYVAVVHGRMAPGEGVIDLPLMADLPNRPMQKVDRADGKSSLTRYRVLAFDAAANTTRVALEPVSGRTHQLRVHLQAIGHPMLGDALYAPPPVLALENRLLLHAESLAFRHPTSGSTIELRCDVPF